MGVFTRRSQCAVGMFRQINSRRRGGKDVRAVKEIEGWEDKQAEGRRENECQCVWKRYLLCFHLLSYGVKTHTVSGCIWFTLAPCVQLKHGCCLYSPSVNAKAWLAVFTKSSVAPMLIACDLRYILCANLKTLNQLHLCLVYTESVSAMFFTRLSHAYLTEQITSILINSVVYTGDVMTN